MNAATSADPEAEPTRKVISRAWQFIKQPEHSNALIAILTAVIALTGIGYTIFAALQWKATNQSAKAAQSAADTARDTLQLTYRPRVMVIGMTQQEPENGRLVVTLDLPNYGPFPARNVKTYEFDAVVAPSESPSRLPYESWYSGPKMLFPNSFNKPEGIRVTGSKTFSSDQISAIKSGTLFGVFDVMVEYQDDFSTVHHAEACTKFGLPPHQWNDVCPWPSKMD